MSWIQDIFRGQQAREQADISDEEIAELQAEMDAWNMANHTEPAK